MTKKRETEHGLRFIQHWLQERIIDPMPPSADIPLEEFILPSPRLSARHHLQLYRQSYIARLRECMKKQFAALCYSLGEELFVQFTDQYLEQHPSKTYSLNTLGEGFAAFLESTRPDRNDEHKESWIDFMIELARFEYAFAELFDEEEPAHGQGIQRAFKHSFPVGRYYLAFAQDRQPDMVLPETTYCLVSRVNFRLSVEEISEQRYKSLAGI